MAADGCPLTWPQQRRNLLLFAACTALQYLAAPVLYVGITQGSLCDYLGADTRTANLPGTVYFAMTAMPALIAWLSPRVQALKRNMLFCYGVEAVMMAATGVAIALPLSAAAKIAIVIVQAGVSGAVMPAAIAFLWEAIGRGSDPSRRGMALGLAFGFGPLLAVAGSLAQMALLGGDFFGLRFSGLSSPTNFVVLYGLGAPCVAVAALLSQLFIVPVVETDAPREPVAGVVGLLVGLPLMLIAVGLMQLASEMQDRSLQRLGCVAGCFASAAFVYHFRSVLHERVLLVATVVTILLYAGNMIPSNMNLYSPEVLGDAPERSAGLQNMLRFGFKVVAGFGLGWLLTRTNPRAGILATGTILLASQIWALSVTGSWYLLAFGIYGAGELVGVYAPNYILSASRPSDMRRNMALVTMLMAPAAPAGYLYGAIVDLANERQLGFRLSFLVCALFILAGMVLAVGLLPKNPKAAEEKEEVGS